MFGLQKPSQASTKIGFIALQSNSRLFTLLFLLVFGFYFSSAQENPIIPLPIKAVADTIKAPILVTNPMDPVASKDSLETEQILKGAFYSKMI